MPRTPRVTIPIDVWVEIKTRFDEDPFAGDGQLGNEIARVISGAMNINRSRLLYEFEERSGKLTFQIHYDRPSWADRGAHRAFFVKDTVVTMSDSTRAAKREGIKDLGLVGSIRRELGMADSK